MPNDHIDVNIDKAVSASTGVGISQNPTTRRPVAPSVETANKPLDRPPPALQKLSNILHNTVSAVMAVLMYSSRPRVLRLVQRVSSRTIFVGVLLILTSLFTIEGVAQQQPAPTGLTATPGDRQVTLSWTPPSGTILGYRYTRKVVGTPGETTTATVSTTVSVTALTNGTSYKFWVEAVNNLGVWSPKSSPVTVTPMIPAPPGLTATPGDRQVTLRWTAPSVAAPVTYRYSQNGNWKSTSITTPYLVTGLENGRSYTFKVRAVRGTEEPGTASRTVTVTPLRAAPRAPQSLNVKRVDNTAILTWSPLSNVGADILRYEYSDDGGSTWKSMGSSSTTYTVTGLEIGKEYTFQIRAVYVREGGNPHYIYSSHPSTSSNSVAFSLKRSRVFECPVGWTRGSVFGNTKKALIYELKVNVDHTTKVSIYELESLAIYVHPDEGLETLEGWYLTTGILYNHDHENKFQLTAENAVIDEHGFAHIQNPEDTPIRMGTLGFIGQSLPSFDYRLYDDSGIRVDFGISCYKEGGLTWRLWNTKDPRVLRMLPFPVSEAALSVRMKELDWQTPFFRTQWTAAIMPDLPDAPAAPSLVKKNIVGTWADLKKQ